ncbi:MAG: glycine/sarcosine/betaine reductase selenoprotein B family protein [Candidatus Velthaea sp.]
MVNSEPTAQLRPGLWETVNARYPGSMIRKTDAVPLAPLRVPLQGARVAFVSSAGVQPTGTLPFDVAHPVGDFSFRRVPSDAPVSQLEIHQLKYPTVGARADLNVIFPIERLRELVADGTIAGLTRNFYSFIGYNMDPFRFETAFAEELASAVESEGPDVVLLAPA